MHMLTALNAMSRTSKAQTISTDAVIAIALFMIVAIFFFSLTSDSPDNRKVKGLEFEIGKLSLAVSGSRNASSAFIIGSKVDEGRLERLANISYQQLKDEIGINAEFCIHFEDEKGNIINVSGNKTGIGSSFVTVGGIKCG